MNNQWWFILFNVSTWLVCFAITKAYANNYYTRGGQLERHSRAILVYLIIWFGSLFVFHGGDNARYSYMVTNYQDQLFLYENGKATIELFYIKLAEFCKGNYVLWKSIVYGIGLLMTYLTCKRFKCNEMMFLYAFTLMVLHAYGVSRVFVAVTIYLFGLSLIENKKNIQTLFGIGVCISSVLFHSSMMLPIALLPSIFFKITKRRFFILLLAVPLFVMLINHVPEYFLANEDFAETMSGNKMNAYTEVGQTTGAGNSFLITIYRLIGYLTIGLMLFYSTVADNKKVLTKTESFVARLAFFVAYFAIVIFFSSINNSETIFYRYYEMDYVLLYAFFPILFSNNSVFPKRSRKMVEYTAITFNAINLLILTYYSFVN